MRIVGGEWRGRRLQAPAGRATRPTSDRVREAVYDVLAALAARGERSVAGARVLDLFAGSGALGLEALSRGAATCTFVERSPEAVRVLRQNIATLGCGETQARVVPRDTRAALRADAAAGSAYTLVVVDAPYAHYEVVERDLRQLLPPLLEASAMLVVETAKGQDVTLPFESLAVKTYGDTKVTFLKEPHSCPAT